MSRVESNITREIEKLKEELRKIRENEIRHLQNRITSLESLNKRGAKSELLGLTIMLWLATPIAFLSIPLLGIACLLTATFSTFSYVKARRHVK